LWKNPTSTKLSSISTAGNTVECRHVHLVICHDNRGAAKASARDVRGLQRWFKVAGNPSKLRKVLAKEYPNIKKVSIDYALMEHAKM